MSLSSELSADNVGLDISNLIWPDIEVNCSTDAGIEDNVSSKCHDSPNNDSKEDVKGESDADNGSSIEKQRGEGINDREGGMDGDQHDLASNGPVLVKIDANGNLVNGQSSSSLSNSSASNSEHAGIGDNGSSKWSALRRSVVGDSSNDLWDSVRRAITDKENALEVSCRLLPMAFPLL